MSSSISTIDDKNNIYEFSSIDDLCEFYNSLTSNDYSIKNDFIKSIDKLFKQYNLYNNWDTSTDITEEIVEILLHLKIDLNSVRMGNISNEINKIIQHEIDVIDKLSEKFGFVMKKSKTSKNDNDERTDKNIIPDSKINCLPESINLMNQLIKNEQIANEHNDIVFNHPKCYPANKTLKTNCYGLDRLGIVINRKFFNSKSKPFSWKYLDGTTTPISYYYDPVLSDEENVNRILSIQYQLQPTAFARPTGTSKSSGVIYKIYSNDPELRERYFNFINMKQINTI